MDHTQTQLGIGSYTYAWAVGIPGYPPPQPMTSWDLLDKATELSVDVVQICDNLPLDRLTAQELNDLHELATERGLAIEVGTRGIAANHLRRHIELAVLFRSPVLRVVLDSLDDSPSLDEIVARLKPMIAEFEQADVCLAIENHDRFTARQFCKIVESLESQHVGICLDTVNSFGALEGPEAVVKALAPHVVNLHVKDFDIQRVDHQLGFAIEGCPAGQGRLDVPWLLNELRSAGRTVNAILEQWPSAEATLEATIEKEERWARESIRYLRSIVEH